MGGAQVIAALEQTAGQGRRGRTWQSPPGGLYFTCALPAGGSPHLATVSLSVGLALCEGLESLAALEQDLLRIKWPNDVHARGGKLAGILCEVVRFEGCDHLLVGVGVNVLAVPLLTADAAAGFAAPPVCLADLTTSSIPPDALLQPLAEAVLTGLNQHLATGLSEGARRAIEARLRGRGCRLDLAIAPDRRLSGELLGLTADGRLQILSQDGKISVPGGAEIVRIHDNWLP